MSIIRAFHFGGVLVYASFRPDPGRYDIETYTDGDPGDPFDDGDSFGFFAPDWLEDDGYDYDEAISLIRRAFYSFDPSKHNLEDYTTDDGNLAADIVFDHLGKKEN